jgi:hypothetical protein
VAAEEVPAQFALVPDPAPDNVASLEIRTSPREGNRSELITESTVGQMNCTGRPVTERSHATICANGGEVQPVIRAISQKWAAKQGTSS